MYNCKQKEHVRCRNEKSFSFSRCFDLKQSNHIGKKTQVFFQHVSMLFLIGSKNSCDSQSRYHADDGSISERKGRKEKRLHRWRTEEGNSNKAASLASILMRKQ